MRFTGSIGKISNSLRGLPSRHCYLTLISLLKWNAWRRRVKSSLINRFLGQVCGPGCVDKSRQTLRAANTGSLHCKRSSTVSRKVYIAGKQLSFCRTSRFQVFERWPRIHHRVKSGCHRWIVVLPCASRRGEPMADDDRPVRHCLAPSC